MYTIVTDFPYSHCQQLNLSMEFRKDRLNDNQTNKNDASYDISCAVSQIRKLIKNYNGFLMK